MGLDQYLTARKYVQKHPNYNFDVVNEKFTELMKLADFPADSSDLFGVYVEARLGYWRKANQIHSWFERVANEGVELKNCDPITVTREELQKLVEDCQTVLDTVKWGETIHHPAETEPYEREAWDERQLASIDSELAAQILPPEQGFFFGSYEYDIWYVLDLENTVEMVTKLLEDPRLGDVEWQYHGWW
jgi:hypothetical protein